MIWDISQEVSERTAVYPGDTPFSRRHAMRMAEGGSCDVGTITMSVHVGTHADAPGHFLEGAASIDRVPLEAYLGRARVVDVRGAGEIGVERLAALDLEGVERVLLRTLSAPDPTRYDTGFAHLGQASARWLAARGLKLVGIDTPSIDRWDSKSLDAHKELAAAGTALLENLVLAHVPEGDYELVALPLRLQGMDGSPVRAVLRRG